MSAAAPTAANVVESDIPARLDRLPWSPMNFAGLIQAGLGVAAEQRSLEDVARPLTARGQPARREVGLESP